MIEPSLPDLQDHISKFQAELKQMRKQFAARKAKLATLISRRTDLQAQLQQVEAEMADEIAALAAEEPPSPAPPAPPPVKAPAPAPVAKPEAAKPAPAPAEAVKKVPAKAPSPPPETVSLRTILLGILKAARKPLTSGELTERVLAGGYKTTSKSPANVVGAQLSKMDNVEHVKGQGYQLKR